MKYCLIRLRRRGVRAHQQRGSHRRHGLTGGVFTVGDVILLRQVGAGQVTVTGGTLNLPVMITAAKTRAQGSVITLHYVATDTGTFPGIWRDPGRDDVGGFTPRGGPAGETDPFFSLRSNCWCTRTPTSRTARAWHGPSRMSAR